MFDIVRFCSKYGIDIADPEDRHARHGWVNIQCPFCKHPHHYHLGYNLNRGYFYCWKCGSHDILSVIKQTLHCTSAQAQEIMQKFQGGQKKSRPMEKRSDRAEECQLPPGTMEIEKGDKAWKYITKTRGLSGEVVNLWGLMKTHPAAKLKSRIAIPFYHDGELVTYQTRDYTQRSDLPYISCPKEKAVRDVKETLYGIDLARNFDSIIVVEGVGDAWNIGPGAVATCGTTWTADQAFLLLRWQTVNVVFDANDPEALDHADSLCMFLTDLGTDANVIDCDLDHDPGDMSREQVFELRKFCEL